MKYGVKLGKNNQISKLVRVFDTFEQAEQYIKDNIYKIKINQHMYVDMVKEVKKNAV